MAAVEATAYVRTQALVAGLLNVIVNPAIDWLSNRRKGAQPLWAADGLAVNFAVTSLILSLLVGVFTAFGVGHEMRAGRLTADLAAPPPRWLHRLPRRGWLMGLIIGTGAAIVSVAAMWLLHQLGAATLPLVGLMLVKAFYTGVLGFLVARWVILRLLADS